jgi:hypothetical protein
MVLAALQNSLRRFGLMTVVEPRFYEYEDGTLKRPDLTVFRDGNAIATDVVISQDTDDAVKKKIEKHAQAAAHRGHEFVPVSMSIWGTFHPCTRNFLRHAFEPLNPQLRRLAILQTMRVMSEAWLAGSMAMINGTTKQTFDVLLGELNEDDFEGNELLAVERRFLPA